MILSQLQAPENSIENTALCWAEKPLRLKFVFGGVLLYAVKFRGLVFNQPFHMLSADPAQPRPPIEELGQGVRAVRILSHPIEKRLPRLAFSSGAIRYVPCQYKRHHIDLPGSFSKYLAKFHAKTRNTLRRKLRKFTEFSQGAIDFREFRFPREMSQFHGLAREVSKKTYQERLSDAGLKESEEFLATITDLARRDSVRGYVLFHRGKPISYMFCPGDSEILNYERAGYDPDYRACDPGTVLFYLVLERLFAEGKYRRFDLGPGHYWYKELFSTGSVLCADIYYFQRTPRNLLVLCTHGALDTLTAILKGTLDRVGLQGRVKKFIRRIL